MLIPVFLGKINELLLEHDLFGFRLLSVETADYLMDFSFLQVFLYYKVHIPSLLSVNLIVTLIFPVSLFKFERKSFASGLLGSMHRTLYVHFTFPNTSHLIILCHFPPNVNCDLSF